MKRVALLVLLILPSLACAHGLGVQAKVVDGQLRVEGYFDDDTPAKSARVTITDEAGAVIDEGQTDDTGTWKTTAPAAGTYRITVRAEDEHRATTTLKIAKAVAETTGPTREEFTRFPWDRMLIGLALIAGLGALVRLFRRKNPRSTT